MQLPFGLVLQPYDHSNPWHLIASATNIIGVFLVGYYGYVRRRNAPNVVPYKGLLAFVAGLAAIFFGARLLLTERHYALWVVVTHFFGSSIGGTMLGSYIGTRRTRAIERAAALRA